jgi:hypothetical protein
VVSKNHLPFALILQRLVAGNKPLATAFRAVKAPGLGVAFLHPEEKVTGYRSWVIGKNCFSYHL